MILETVCKPTFYSEAVQETLTQAVINIQNNIEKVLSSARGEEKNLQCLDKHIKLSIIQDIANADVKTQRVFRKLYTETQKLELVKLTMALIYMDTGKQASAYMLLSSFVLPEAQITMQKLQMEHLEELENPAIWPKE